MTGKTTRPSKHQWHKRPLKVQEIIDDLHQEGSYWYNDQEMAFTNNLLNANTAFLHTDQYSQTNPNWKTYNFGLWRPNWANIIIDHILQSIAKSQKSYLKDTTEVIILL